MKPELILIANATCAHLFTRASHMSPLVPLATLEQPEGRRKSSELGHDRAGYGMSDHRAGSVNFPPRLDLRRKKHLEFAHLLAQRVDDALLSGSCDRITLFASSPFLGDLKGQLSAGAKKALVAAIDVDLTSFGRVEITQRIDQKLHDLPRQIIST